jgi:hypothetical protein
MTSIREALDEMRFLNHTEWPMRFGYTVVSSVISRAMKTTIPFRVRSAQIETFRFPSGNYFL